jgi:hypothetical protein
MFGQVNDVVNSLASIPPVRPRDWYMLRDLKCYPFLGLALFTHLSLQLASDLREPQHIGSNDLYELQYSG